MDQTPASTNPARTSLGQSAGDSSHREDCGGEGPELTGDLSDEQMQKIAKAIADPQRFAILCSISERDEVPCKMLVAEFPITQATISHHLKELVAAGLIRSRRQGQMAILSCRRDVCGAYTDMLTRRLTR